MRGPGAFIAGLPNIRPDQVDAEESSRNRDEQVHHDDPGREEHDVQQHNGVHSTTSAKCTRRVARIEARHRYVLQPRHHKGAVHEMPHGARNRARQVQVQQPPAAEELRNLGAEEVEPEHVHSQMIKPRLTKRGGHDCVQSPVHHGVDRNHEVVCHEAGIAKLPHAEYD